MLYLLCSYLQIYLLFCNGFRGLLKMISCSSPIRAQRESLLDLYHHGMTPCNRTAATAPITGPRMTTGA